MNYGINYASMKHTFALIIIFLESILCLSAQTILTDEETENGYFISTTMQDVYNENGKNGSISLGVAYNEAMQTFFSLNLQLSNEEKVSIKAGNTLQLITFDGEIILLRNTLNMTPDKYINEGRSVIISYGVQYNEQELADLDHIMNEHIVKIKIETDNGIIEHNIENNEFSKSVYQCFSVLKKHLESKKL